MNDNTNDEWKFSTAGLMKAHGFAAQADHHKAFENAAKAAELSREILALSRSTLMINMRFLEAAFVRISPVNNMETLSIATDGQFLYYDPIHVCRQFRRAKELPARDMLHVTLHCLFRHLFVGKKVRADIWDLACDIAVENIISKMDLRSLYAERQTSQAWLIRELEKELPKLSAEWIYKYFSEQDPDETELTRLRENFIADDHSIWHNPTVYEKGSGDADQNDAGQGDGGDMKVDAVGAMENELPTDDEQGDSASAGEEQLIKSEEGDGEGGGGSGERDDDKRALTPEELEQMWSEVAERIELDLDFSSSESWGEGAGQMQQRLREINREKFDYSELLRRFSVLGESVELNDDEFDYIFYTYGMRLYHDMPLVEPLEYRDSKKIREFVIAIDTSESVSGEIVQKFVTKTWNILKQSESFFSRVNVHIIQCSARIEEDVRINTQEEFDLYMKDMVIKGLGGTDFRPVFEYVDELLLQHEFTNLKGLIYFTDGYGAFPSSPPPYDAAFVILDQGYDLPSVPVWAIRMVLKEDEIKLF